MNLVRFLLFGSVISIIFGEFGHYPFGSTSGSVQLTDFLTGLTVIVFLIWVIRTKLRLKIPQAFKILLIFWLIAFLSLIIASIYIPLIEISKASLYLVRFILYSSIFLIAYQLKSVEFIKQLTKIFLIAGLGFVLSGLMQITFFPNFNWLTNFGFDPHQSRLASTFLDPNFAGAFLVFIVALLANKIEQNKNNLWIYSGLLLTSIALVLTYSRSAYLMTGVLLFSLAIIKWRKILFIFPLILLIILFVPRVQERVVGGFNIDKSASARMESWQNGWTIFQQSPVIGVGFNTLRFTQQQMNLIKPYSADGGHSGSGVDSSLLLVLATTGIIGFAVYIWFWGKVIFNLFKNKNVLSLTTGCLMISLLINSQFINSLFYAPLMLSYFSLLGLVYEE